MNQIIDQLLADETALLLLFSPLIALACFMVYDIIREDNENDKREKEHRKYREAREAASGEARPDRPLDGGDDLTGETTAGPDTSRP